MAVQSRIPPQSLESERALLGALMIRPDALHDIMDVLSPDGFYSEKHRIIFRAMLALWSKNEPIDLETMRAKLAEKNELSGIGGLSYLAELTADVPAAGNAGHYAAIVHKKHALRNLTEAGENIAELGFSEAEELDETLDKAEKRIYEVAHASTASKFISMKDSLAEAWERLEHLNENKGEMRGAPTGFKDLDSLLAGLQKSDLIILAARPSVGKTALALDIARQSAVKHGTVVCIFSLEMASQQLVDRMVAAEAKVSAWGLRTGTIRDPADFERIRDAYGRLSQAPIFIDDQPGCNILKMRATTRRIKREHGLGLIVIDYLQLMMPTNSRGSDSTVQQVTEISRSLKILAREMDVPVLALSQLSRAVEQRGGKPRLSDLRDSGCLTGDTLIIRADTGQRVPISELVGQKNVPVFSLTADYRLQPMLASRIFPSGRKAIFELRTRSGRTIRASGNHPFLTLEGWQRLDALQEQDRIALPRKLSAKGVYPLSPHGETPLPLPTQGEGRGEGGVPVRGGAQAEHHGSNQPLHPQELILLAHLLGDGCVLPRQPIHYTSADPENLSAVERAAQTLFNIIPRRVAQKNWWHSYLPAPYRLARGTRHPIMNWFAQLSIEPVRAPFKRIPDAVFRQDDDAIRLFLHHLWATDGNISRTHLAGRKPAAAIYYSSTSEHLARDVQHLLLRLGIWSNLRTVPQGKHRPSYQVHIQSAPVQRRFLELIGSHGARGSIVPELLQDLAAIAPIPNTDTIPREVWDLFIRPAKDEANLSWRDFSKELEVSYNGSAVFVAGVSRPRLAKIAQKLSSESLLHLAQSDVYWDEIVSITPQGEEDVFDMTVPGTHNFVAGDIIVHNSIEQDADVVMFIHREDKQKENSDRPNIAEILVEKHRNGPVGKVELYYDDKRTTFLTMDNHGYGAMAESSGAMAAPGSADSPFGAF